MGGGVEAIGAGPTWAAGSRVHGPDLLIPSPRE
ncbi:hypothetical protein SFR_4021 [Streptomyces sp. FR-008]|nr:hypothetical protein SFR_4021 [Streptomyces sp. FR-008]